MEDREIAPIMDTISHKTPPKKNTTKQCNNCLIISLFSHSSKLLLRIIPQGLSHQAKRIIGGKKAGLSENRNTIITTVNFRDLGEKYLEHQGELYYVFIDF